MSPAVQWAVLFIVSSGAVFVAIYGLLGIRWHLPTLSAVGLFLLGAVLLLGAAAGLVNDAAWSVHPDDPERTFDNIAVGTVAWLTGTVGLGSVLAGLVVAREEGLRR